jgi:hypothetical protein
MSSPLRNIVAAQRPSRRVQPVERVPLPDPITGRIPGRPAPPVIDDEEARRRYEGHKALTTVQSPQEAREAALRAAGYEVTDADHPRQYR